MIKKAKDKKQRKQRISADGTPYTIWQVRTHWLCVALIVWAVIELSAGIGLLSLSFLNIFHLQEFVPALSVGPYTIANGAVNLIVAILGLWGAYNPKRITVFFWLVVLDALLSSWSTASAVSQGQIDPATTLSLIIVLAFAACAWNVRGQTGYFDNHPHPEDDVLKDDSLEDSVLKGGNLEDGVFKGDNFKGEKEAVLRKKEAVEVSSHTLQ